MKTILRALTALAALVTSAWAAPKEVTVVVTPELARIGHYGIIQKISGSATVAENSGHFNPQIMGVGKAGKIQVGDKIIYMIEGSIGYKVGNRRIDAIKSIERNGKMPTFLQPSKQTQARLAKVTFPDVPETVVTAVTPVATPAPSDNILTTHTPLETPATRALPEIPATVPALPQDQVAPPAPEPVQKPVVPVIEKTNPPVKPMVATNTAPQLPPPNNVLNVETKLPLPTKTEEKVPQSMTATPPAPTGAVTVIPFDNLPSRDGSDITETASLGKSLLKHKTSVAITLLLIISISAVSVVMYKKHDKENLAKMREEYKNKSSTEPQTKEKAMPQVSAQLSAAIQRTRSAKSELRMLEGSLSTLEMQIKRCGDEVRSQGGGTARCNDLSEHLKYLENTAATTRNEIEVAKEAYRKAVLDEDAIRAAETPQQLVSAPV